MDLTKVVPQPTPISLGGRTWHAREFTLADLSRLQGWVNTLDPSPFDQAAVELLNRPRDLTWKKLLRDVLDRQERWPPDMDGHIWTEAGVILQLQIGLGIDEEAARKIYATSGQYPVAFAEQIERFFRVVWGTDPMGIIQTMIDGPRPKRQDDKPEDWGMYYYQYLRECRNGPPFGDLTISQFRAWRMRGGTAESDREDYVGVAEHRRGFWEGVE